MYIGSSRHIPLAHRDQIFKPNPSKLGISSILDSHVSQPQSRTGRTAAQQTCHLVGKRISYELRGAYIGIHVFNIL